MMPTYSRHSRAALWRRQDSQRIRERIDQGVHALCCSAAGFSVTEHASLSVLCLCGRSLFWHRLQNATAGRSRSRTCPHRRKGLVNLGLTNCICHHCAAAAWTTGLGLPVGGVSAHLGGARLAHHVRAVRPPDHCERVRQQRHQDHQFRAAPGRHGPDRGLPASHAQAAQGKITERELQCLGSSGHLGRPRLRPAVNG